MSAWYSIEVFDGATSATLWAEVYGDALVEAAVTSGAADWAWHHHTWGVLLELEFADDEAWGRFRELPAVEAAIEKVPDPVTGVIMYRGRGGSSGRAQPRRPKPLAGSGSVALPLPWELDAEPNLSIWSLLGEAAPVPAFAGQRR
ncbi:MAG: hypothetical protein ACR2NJ_03360 [Acidimicrobiales bacterium]